MMKIYLDIMNNQEKSRLLSDDEKKEEKKVIILKVLPWICFNYNIFFQIVGIIFIIFLIKRIKFKSDFGIAPEALNQNGSASNRNVMIVDNSNINNNNDKSNKSEKKKARKSIKKNKRSKSVTGKDIPSIAGSEQIEINKKARKRGSKRRSKSKEKRKSK